VFSGRTQERKRKRGIPEKKDQGGRKKVVKMPRHPKKKNARKKNKPRQEEKEMLRLTRTNHDSLRPKKKNLKKESNSA